MAATDGKQGRCLLCRPSGELLEGGRPPYPCSLTAREMDSLTAICDTLLPSITSGGDEPLGDFYGTSASMIRIPEKSGGWMSGKVKHPSVGALRLALWLLSTWWGTLALCGAASLSGEFPFFRKFSSTPAPAREVILRSWASSSLFHCRLLFKSLKFAVAFNFFSDVNEKNHNPAWKAMGYCGPDPRFTARSEHRGEERVKKESHHCLLHGVIVDGSSSESTIREAFRLAGFSISPAATSTSPLVVECDACIVGSGSGGSVVAAVLAERGYKVVVMEKGRYFARTDLSLLEGPSLDSMYEGGGIVCTDDVGALLVAGATVGGGSTVNWSAAISPPRHVLNEWCDEYQLKLFGSKSFERAVDAVCDRLAVQSEACEEGFNNAVLRKGCLALGHQPMAVPRNAPADHHCGWCHLGCRDGRKMSAQETWLLDMAGTKNGAILQCCEAIEVTQKTNQGCRRNTATGVSAKLANGATIHIQSAVTVVACGALNTPPLLKRSGLRNTHIGRNLHIHPTVMAWGYFPAEGGRDHTWPEAGKKAYEGGIITTMFSPPDNKDVVIQTPVLHPGMYSVLTPWVSSEDFKRRMTRFSRTAHLFALARDRGSGNTGNYPDSLTYKLDPSDAESLGSGSEAMLKILVAAGAEEVGTHHLSGEVFDVRKRGGTGEELERFAREEGRRGLSDGTRPLCSAHQMGSCRMGASPAASAVGPEGECWEVERLFVADTSVFPTALGVNPMVTVMAVAYCVGHNVVDVLSKMTD